MSSPEDTLRKLEQLVQKGTELRGQSLCLMYDEEDGFFLSTVETGCHNYPVKDIDTSARHGTLAEAVDAAVEWHNNICATRRWEVERITA